jgi:hypothetical protein
LFAAETGATEAAEAMDADNDTTAISADQLKSGETGWSGPEWDDPLLTMLARQLREAHRRVAALPGEPRRRLTRHLLIITDLAKRDPGLAAQRLATFLADVGTVTRR